MNATTSIEQVVLAPTVLEAARSFLKEHEPRFQRVTSIEVKLQDEAFTTKAYRYESWAVRAEGRLADPEPGVEVSN